ncbi:MAG: hypothetical protein Q9172_007737 [Xanthocarpia lactea]
MSEAECSEPDGMLGVFPLDGIPSEASPVDYDDDNKQLNSDFQPEFDQNAQLGRQSSRRYNKVAVLLISWERSYDDLDTEREVDELAKIFRVTYNYKVQNVRLKSTGARLPQVQVNKVVADFVYDEDGPSTLLLFYYAGHGVPGQRQRSLGLVFDDPATVVWNCAEAALQQTQGDIIALRVLAKESSRFKTSTLADKIREAPNFPRTQVPILIARNDLASLPRIVIAPLIGGDEVSTAVPTRSQEVDFLGLRNENQGKRAAAEKVYEQALNRKEPALGPNRPSTLETTNTSDSVHAFRGLYTEAEEIEKWGLGNHHLPVASISASSTGSDSSETASIASVAWSDSSKSSVSMGASDTLEAGLEEIAEFLLSDKELYQIFVEALTRHNRDKVLKNGARLLKWFGRRLVVSAGKTVEREAAEFFQNRRHCRSIMDRIALQIPENSTEKIWQGQMAQGQLQKLINRDRLEAHLRRTIETTGPIDNESEHSIDSEDEQQNGEEEPNLNLDAAKSFLKSSDALVRLKEEMGDLISPFGSKAMWKKTLWIDGQQVYFELPDTVPQRTRIDILKLALEKYLKMPIIWWPFKQPRRCLLSNKVRIVLPCHLRIYPKKMVVKCKYGTKKEVLPTLNERHEYTYQPYLQFLDEDDHVNLAEQALIHYYHGYETCHATDHFSKLVDSIPCRVNGVELGLKGYGIWARQGWTLPKLAAFALVTQGWAVGFAACWLYKYPGDLQNAFVPALYWLGIITIFVVVPDVFRT